MTWKFGDLNSPADFEHCKYGFVAFCPVEKLETQLETQKLEFSSSVVI